MLPLDQVVIGMVSELPIIDLLHNYDIVRMPPVIKLLLYYYILFIVPEGQNMETVA